MKKFISGKATIGLSGIIRKGHDGKSPQPDPEKGEFILEHRDPIFRLRRIFVVTGKTEEISFECTTDGKETVTTKGNQVITSRMVWDGDVLVLDQRIVMEEREANNRVRYRLEDGVFFPHNLAGDEMIPPWHLFWSKSKIDLDDPFQREWSIRQILPYGRTEDVARLDWEEARRLLPLANGSAQDFQHVLQDRLEGIFHNPPYFILSHKK
jgi:hypothetical protein